MFKLLIRYCMALGTAFVLGMFASATWVGRREIPAVDWVLGFAFLLFWSIEIGQGVMRLRLQADTSRKRRRLVQAP